MSGQSGDANGVHGEAPHSSPLDGNNNGEDQQLASGEDKEEKEVSEGEQRTLYISNLPMDVRYREVYNLCCTFPGFEHCSLNTAGRAPVAFAIFKDHDTAITCKNALTGRKLDPELHIELRVEFARTNTHATRKRVHSGPPLNPRDDKRYRAAPPVYPPGPHSPLANLAPVTPPRAREYVNPYPMPLKPMVPLSVGVGATASRSRSQPCTTLFVAALGPFTQEQDLRELFANRPGFRRLNMSRDKTGAPVAFVDFEDVGSSSAALAATDGHLLVPSDRNGIRVDYAKNPMGTASSKSVHGGGGGGGGGGVPSSPGTYPSYVNPPAPSYSSYYSSNNSGGGGGSGYAPSSATNYDSYYGGGGSGYGM